MKRIALIITVISTLIFIFIACERENSSDVNQDRIYALYEIYYDKAEDVSYARASFFFGSITGTKLQLSSPSNVKFNNVEMGFKNALAYYETSNAGFIEQGTFVWTDLDGNSFTNIATVKTIDLPENMDTITKGQAYELTWIGEPLGSDENVWVFINGQMENDEVNAYQTTPGATKVILTATQTNKLSVGTNQIFIQRRNNTEAQEKTSAGAKCAGIYKSQTYNIEVK